MAYLRKIDLRCWHDACDAQAKHEVLGDGGENYGNFCVRHAKQKQRQVVAQEEDARAIAIMMNPPREPVADGAGTVAVANKEEIDGHTNGNVE